jgi:hypothetical protein
MLHAVFITINVDLLNLTTHDDQYEEYTAVTSTLVKLLNKMALHDQHNLLCSGKGQRGKRLHHCYWHLSDWRNHEIFRSD